MGGGAGKYLGIPEMGIDLGSVDSRPSKSAKGGAPGSNLNPKIPKRRQHRFPPFEKHERWGSLISEEKANVGQPR
jgi:hypothetical protein